ncbi:MAG: hypothetical protein CMO34_04515 [Verrucomicrobia bacterium]|mgnify:CR=1 FL=1|nr:hypothetical protein [Verrucomicrobiota bacterium]|tara:strand:+ start:526 stop:810 length:285 start_codon:yes stop_codon:yes gene_type:complete
MKNLNIILIFSILTIGLFQSSCSNEEYDFEEANPPISINLKNTNNNKSNNLTINTNQTNSLNATYESPTYLLDLNSIISDQVHISVSSPFLVRF